jgi:hypothetical protein
MYARIGAEEIVSGEMRVLQTKGANRDAMNFFAEKIISRPRAFYVLLRPCATKDVEQFFEKF